MRSQVKPTGKRPTGKRLRSAGAAGASIASRVLYSYRWSPSACALSSRCAALPRAPLPSPWTSPPRASSERSSLCGVTFVCRTFDLPWPGRGRAGAPFRGSWRVYHLPGSESVRCHPRGLSGRPPTPWDSTREATYSSSGRGSSWTPRFPRNLRASSSCLSRGHSGSSLGSFRLAENGWAAWPACFRSRGSVWKVLSPSPGLPGDPWEKSGSRSLHRLPVGEYCPAPRGSLRTARLSA